MLDEVSLIPSDFVKGRYLTKLLATTTLEPAMLERLIDQSGRELKSDFELGRVLTTVAKRGLPNDRLRLTYVRATTSIGSAFETGRSLGALVAAGPNSGEVSAAIVRRGATIGSDFELSRLLVAVLGTPGGRDTLEGPLFEALATLGSDFERGRVLTTVCKLPDLTPGAQLAVLDATRKTGSSFEAARILDDADRPAASDRTGAGAVPRGRPGPRLELRTRPRARAVRGLDALARAPWGMRA